MVFIRKCGLSLRNIKTFLSIQDIFNSVIIEGAIIIISGHQCMLMDECILFALFENLNICIGYQIRFQMKHKTKYSLISPKEF